MKKYNIEWVPYEEDYIAINPATGDWLILDENAKGIVEDMDQDKDIQSIIKKHRSISKYDIINVVSKINKYDFTSQKDTGSAHSCSTCHDGEFPRLAVLNLTEACNLKCSYCYVGAGEGKTEFMTFETARRVIDEYLAMNKEGNINIVLHGGEPLLNYPLIEKLVEYVKPHKERLKLCVQTNATLIDDSKAKFLTDNEVSVGVSIDGPDDYQNATRPMGSGKGSFDKVMEGIKYLQKYGHHFGTITVLTSHNVEHIGEIIDFLVQTGVRTMAFSPIIKVGRGLKDEESFLTGQQIFEAYKIVTDKVIRHNACHGDDKIKERFLAELGKSIFYNIHEYMCMRAPCGSGRSILGIGVNGDIFTCDDFINDDNFKIGNVHAGSIKEQMLNSTMLKEHIKRSMKDLPRCSNCQWRSLCGGICRSADYYSGANGIEETEMCHFYKLFIPYLIKLCETCTDLPKFLDPEMEDDTTRFVIHVNDEKDRVDVECFDALMKVHTIGKMNEIYLCWDSEKYLDEVAEFFERANKKCSMTWLVIDSDNKLFEQDDFTAIFKKPIRNIKIVNRSDSMIAFKEKLDRIGKMLNQRKNITYANVVIEVPYPLIRNHHRELLAFAESLGENDSIIIDGSEASSEEIHFINYFLKDIRNYDINAKINITKIDVDFLENNNLQYYQEVESVKTIVIDEKHFEGITVKDNEDSIQFSVS